MRKFASLFSLLLACILCVSCGEDNATMTGKGIFGVLPQYLSQYYELKKQCFNELDFEDNKQKKSDITNKYQEQWEKYAADVVKAVSKDSPLNKEVAIIAPEELGLTNVHLEAKGLDLNIKGQSPEASLFVEMRYEEEPTKSMCFFLDENDSIIYADNIVYRWGHEASSGVVFSDLYISRDVDYSQMILDLYALDKTKKIKICTNDEEIQAGIQSSDRHKDALIKSLHDVGIIKYASLEELKNDKKKLFGFIDETDKIKPGAVDLAYFDLKGRVKSVTLRDRYDTMIQNTFTSKGKWDTTNGAQVGGALTDVKRDAEKRIIEYTEGEYDDIASYKITYDAKTGWVTKCVCDSEGTVTTTLTYNEKGNVTQLKQDGFYQEMGAESETKVNETITYEYVKFDDHGNWTSRTAKSSDGTSWKETRRITYYN